ncbi:MAG: hypothetical protein GXO91_08695 [FCB group bacterium]|nr:hypothetical protein [FCB group bacterium]
MANLTGCATEGEIRKMVKKFVYYYFMKPETDKIGKLVPDHAAYWETANLPDYSGGPFADRNGGLIIFGSDNLETARELVQKDPFVVAGVIAKSWLKEWLPQ